LQAYAVAPAGGMCCEASLHTTLLHFVKGDDFWFAAWFYVERPGKFNTLMDLETTFVERHPGMRIRLGRPAFESPDGQAIVVFTRWGFAGLCAYLVLLYGATYALLRPEGLPSLLVQSMTLVFYALGLAGLWYHRPSKPLPETVHDVDKSEWHLVKWVFAILVVLALVLSLLAGHPVLYIPIMLNFVIWTILGFVLTAVAIAKGTHPRPSKTDQPDASIFERR